MEENMGINMQEFLSIRRDTLFTECKVHPLDKKETTQKYILCTTYKVKSKKQNNFIHL